MGFIHVVDTKNTQFVTPSRLRPNCEQQCTPPWMRAPYSQRGLCIRHRAIADKNIVRVRWYTTPCPTNGHAESSRTHATNNTMHPLQRPAERSRTTRPIQSIPPLPDKGIKHRAKTKRTHEQPKKKGRAVTRKGYKECSPYRRQPFLSTAKLTTVLTSHATTRTHHQPQHLQVVTLKQSHICSSPHLYIRLDRKMCFAD